MRRGENRAKTVTGSDYHLELSKTYKSTQRFKKPNEAQTVK